MEMKGPKDTANTVRTVTPKLMKFLTEKEVHFTLPPKYTGTFVNILYFILKFTKM